MVSGSCRGILVRSPRRWSDNAALPVLGSLRGEGEGMEGFRAERLTQFDRRWCGGNRARPWRSLRWRLLAREDSEGGGRVREWESTD
jgi:hypothetical protein